MVALLENRLLCVCDGCGLLLGCIASSGGRMPSCLRGHDVFVHGGSPFGPIVNQLLPGVNVDLHTYKVSFDYIATSSASARWRRPIRLVPCLLIKDVRAKFSTRQTFLNFYWGQIMLYLFQK